MVMGQVREDDFTSIYQWSSVSQIYLVYPSYLIYFMVYWVCRMNETEIQTENRRINPLFIIHLQPVLIWV